MRTVNMAKSAYVRMNFVNTFFDAYELFDQPVIAFGVLTKSLAAALKTHRICRYGFACHRMVWHCMGRKDEKDFSKMSRAHIQEPPAPQAI